MSTQASDLDGEGIFNFFMPYTLDCDIPEGFPTLKAAVECAKGMLDLLEFDAVGAEGWHVDMDKFVIVDAVGTVYYRFKRIDEIPRPDDIDEDEYSESFGDYWNPDWDYVCGYELREVVEKVGS